jgi:hypothetical protein
MTDGDFCNDGYVDVLSEKEIISATVSMKKAKIRQETAHDELSD